jgi:hypothetical protein
MATIALKKQAPASVPLKLSPEREHLSQMIAECQA